MTGHLRELPAKHIAQMCVHCGAPNVHRIGALDETCASCRAPMIPRRTVMMQGLAAVQVGADRARRAGEAAWAQRTVAVEGAQHYAWTLAFAGACSGVYVMAIVGFAPLLQAGGEALVSLILPTLIYGTMAGVGLRTFWRYERDRTTWRVRWRALADQLGAARIEAPNALASWAASWWDDRLAPDWLRPGPGRGTLLVTIAGFPVAITGQLQSPFFSSSNAYVTVLLAAELPRDVGYWHRMPEAKEIEAELKRAGFSLELRSGGLAVRAEYDALRAILRVPDRLAFLAVVAHGMARLAHLLRASPPRRRMV
jgi:hypothetical protein